MNRRLFATLCIVGLLATSSALATKTGYFRSLEDMVNAPDLLIVDVPSPREKVDVVFAMGARPEYVTVLRDFHGKYQPGQKAEVVVLYRNLVQPGRRYLLAGPGSSENGRPLFNFHPGVVEIPGIVSNEELKSLAADELIPRILQARKEVIAQERTSLDDQEQAIDRVLNKTP